MASTSVGRSLLLLLLIIMMSAAGLVWFDYLNVIDIKTVAAPVYKLLGIEGRSQPPTEKGQMLNLDDERLAVRLEALQLRQMELDAAETGIAARANEIEQQAADLNDRADSLNQQQTALDALSQAASARDKNLDQSARQLNGMPPQNAVAIIAAMEDQEAIDVLRKVDEIAAAAGVASTVSYWMSLMEPARAAELLRKMNARPD